jgi:hypothetical protein
MCYQTIRLDVSQGYYTYTPCVIKLSGWLSGNFTAPPLHVLLNYPSDYQTVLLHLNSMCYQTFIVERHFYFGRHFGFCTQLAFLYANLYCFVWFGPAGAIILIIRPPPMHQGPAGASAVGTFPAAFQDQSVPMFCSGLGMTGAIIVVICLPPMFQGQGGVSRPNWGSLASR